MATEKQNAANRENAKHCTGPNTEGGKAKSSQNAIKSGIYADREVLPFENQSELEELKAEFYARLQPTLPEERSLVDAMIRSEWLLRRYMMVECGIWRREFHTTTHGAIGTAYRHHTDEFDRVGRRQSRVQRDYQNALKQLVQMRAKGSAVLSPVLSPAGDTPETGENTPSQPAATEELNQKLVSFRQNFTKPSEAPPMPPFRPAQTIDTAPDPSASYAEIENEPPKAA